jgi:hypothetical protein
MAVFHTYISQEALNNKRVLRVCTVKLCVRVRLQLVKKAQEYEEEGDFILRLFSFVLRLF